jgi:hypothetical protein
MYLLLRVDSKFMCQEAGASLSNKKHRTKQKERGE